jgi:hypothetical protein
MHHADPRAGFFEDTWWRLILNMVRFVVYEKGRTCKAQTVKIFGFTIPYRKSGSHPPLEWDKIMKTITKKNKIFLEMVNTESTVVPLSPLIPASRLPPHEHLHDVFHHQYRPTFLGLRPKPLTSSCYNRAVDRKLIAI